MKPNLHNHPGGRESLTGATIRGGGWKRPWDGTTEVRASVLATAVPRAEALLTVDLSNA